MNPLTYGEPCRRCGAPATFAISGGVEPLYLCHEHTSVNGYVDLSAARTPAADPAAALLSALAGIREATARMEEIVAGMGRFPKGGGDK